MNANVCVRVFVCLGARECVAFIHVRMETLLSLMGRTKRTSSRDECVCVCGCVCVCERECVCRLHTHTHGDASKSDEKDKMKEFVQ